MVGKANMAARATVLRILKGIGLAPVGRLAVTVRVRITALINQAIARLTAGRSAGIGADGATFPTIQNASPQLFLTAVAAIPVTVGKSRATGGAAGSAGTSGRSVVTAATLPASPTVARIAGRIHLTAVTGIAVAIDPPFFAAEDGALPRLAGRIGVHEGAGGSAGATGCGIAREIGLASIAWISITIPKALGADRRAVSTSATGGAVSVGAGAAAPTTVFQG